MRQPSRVLRKHLKAAMGERDFFLGLQEKKENLESLKTCMESPFGAALIAALETIESSAFATLAKTNVLNFPRILQAKAELRVAQYVKAALLAYVTDLDSINEQLKGLYEEDQASV